MEFLKKLFNDDDYVVGLSGFKEIQNNLPYSKEVSVKPSEKTSSFVSEVAAKQTEGFCLLCQREGDYEMVEEFYPQYNIFTPPKNLVFSTNTKDNFLLS
ncbi:hypothetical protein J6P92_05360 [bacterium]|nr:hypothetical protein [bacterium]